MGLDPFEDCDYFMFNTCMLCGVCGETTNQQHIGPWPTTPITDALHGRWPKSYVKDMDLTPKMEIMKTAFCGSCFEFIMQDRKVALHMSQLPIFPDIRDSHVVILGANQPKTHCECQACFGSMNGATPANLSEIRGARREVDNFMRNIYKPGKSSTADIDQIRLLCQRLIDHDLNTHLHTIKQVIFDHTSSVRSRLIDLAASETAGSSNGVFIDRILQEHHITLWAAKAQEIVVFDIEELPYSDIAWILFAHFQFLNDVLLDPTIVACLRRPADAFLPSLREVVLKICECISQRTTMHSSVSDELECGEDCELHDHDDDEDDDDDDDDDIDDDSLDSADSSADLVANRGKGKPGCVCTCAACGGLYNKNDPRHPQTVAEKLRKKFDALKRLKHTTSAPELLPLAPSPIETQSIEELLAFIEGPASKKAVKKDRTKKKGGKEVTAAPVTPVTPVKTTLDAHISSTPDQPAQTDANGEAKLSKKAKKKAKLNLAASLAAATTTSTATTGSGNVSNAVNTATSTHINEANANPVQPLELGMSQKDIEAVFRPVEDPSALIDEVDIEIDMFKRFCGQEVPNARPKVTLTLNLHKT